MRGTPYIILILLIPTLFSCQQSLPLSQTNNFYGMWDLGMGNLIFICDSSNMGQAIQSSTSWNSNRCGFTHVGITELTDSGVYVIDASPSLGVARRPLLDFIFSVYDTNSDYEFLQIAEYYMVDVPFDTTTFLERLHSFIGQPYDPYFMHDNGRLYCSELVYECFFDRNGHHLFPAKPMNFKAADGTMPPYWQHHFEHLGIAIPQDMPGTNPNDMSKSPILHKFRIE